MDIEISNSPAPSSLKRKAYLANYYQDNKQELLESGKKRREDLTPEEKQYWKDYMKSYIKNNAKKINKANVQWKKKHKDKWNQYQREQYQKKKQNKSD